MIWTKILSLINLLNKQFSNQLDLIYAKMLQDILLDVKSTFEKELVKADKVSYTSLNKKRRMDMLITRIKHRNNKVFNEIIDEIEQMNKIIYSDSYLRTAHDLEMQARINLGFSLPSENKIKHILKNPVDRLRLPKVLQRNSMQVIKEIKSIITQGVLLGEGYAKVANRISGRLGISKRKALATARTETARASSIAQEKAKKHAEKVVGIKIDKYWISALDSRVRSTHQHLDGQKADEQGYFYSNGNKALMPRLFGVASEDINCRCGVVHKLPKTRRARDYDNIDYQKKLVKRIDDLMSQGLTEKLAEKRANREILPPSKQIKWQNYFEWKNSLFQQSLKTVDDPIREAQGSMFESHPTETQKTIESLKEIGVEVVFNDSGTMGYQPSGTKGNPGRISIDKEASYSALVHEKTHAFDDYENGWNGNRMLWDYDERWKFEKHAYDVEIQMALLNNLEESYIIRLRELKAKEYCRIYEINDKGE